MTATSGAIFFAGFWIATGLALRFHARPRVRRLYLIFFFVCLIAPGLLGRQRWLWPFHEWHMWGGLRGYQSSYVDLHIGDAAGNYLPYDSHAVPPKLPTQTQWMGEWLLDERPATQRDEMVRFLLQRGNLLRAAILNDAAPPEWLSFPKREFGRRWRADELRAIGPFVSIRARQIAFAIRPDGRAVEQKVVEDRRFP